MAVFREIWISDIKENLYESNDFLKYSIDWSEFAIGNVLHVPQAGSNPNVSVDRAVLPAKIGNRIDTERQITLRELTTDPAVVTNFEEMQLSYSKRQSVMGQHISTIAQVGGIIISNGWAPQNKQVKTSGPTVATALAPGATGTRKALIQDDIRSLAQAMDRDNVPNDGNRFLLLPVDMYYQLFPVSGSTDISLISAFTVGSTPLIEGKFPNLYGFQIFKKPTVARYDVSFNKKAYNASNATTDNLGGVAWHSKFVARAFGDIKLFSDTDRAEYYGSLFSAMVPVAGASVYANELGTYAIVQN